MADGLTVAARAIMPWSSLALRFALVVGSWRVLSILKKGARVLPER
jgi:hypothetical protein